MSIGKLVSLVHPPINPAGKDNLSRDGVARELGFQIPDSYWHYGLVYGSGAFDDLGRLSLVIFNPCSMNYLTEVKAESFNLREAKRLLGEDYIPFGIFPSPGGLLPYGCDDNGVCLSWITTGHPNTWHTVILSPEGYIETHSLPFPEILAGIFTQSLGSALFGEPFFSNAADVSFRAIGE